MVDVAISAWHRIGGCLGAGAERLAHLVGPAAAVWGVVKREEEAVAGPHANQALAAGRLTRTLLALIVVSLALALAINTRLKGMTLFRSAYFLPFIVSMVAVAVVWRWVYNGDFGLLNWFLGLFGVPKVDWLGNPTTAMPAVAAMFVWKNLGWNMTLFLAGLQGIPQHLYEAAALDGAGRWQQFRHITWPLLAPTTFFVTVTTIIGNFQVFDAIYLMTQGGPGRSTQVYIYLLYNQAFKFFNMGYAAAMAWVLCLILAVLIFVQFRVLGRRVQYELG